MSTHPKQKKPWWALGIVAVLAAIGLVWAFIPSRSYEDCIPAQAKAVLRLEPKALQSLAQGSGFLSEWPEAAQAIDGSQAVYAFVTPNEYIGLAAALADEAKFHRFVERLVKEKKCLSIEESSGHNWAWLTSGWLMSWTDDAFCVLGPGVAQEREQLRQIMTRMMDADTHFTDTENYQTLLRQGGTAQLYAQADALPTPYNLLFRFGLPADCDPAAVQIFAAAETKSTADGHSRTEISCTMTSENEAIAAMLQSSGRGEKNIAASARTESGNALFRMVAATKGKALLETIRANETLRDALLALNQAFDASRLLDSTDGVLCLDVDSLAKDWTPTFCLRGETSRSDLLADADYWVASARKQPGIRMERITPTSFHLRNNKQELVFGTQDKPHSYYFASPSMTERLSQPMPASGKEAKDGVQLYCQLNLQKLFSQPCLKDSEISNWLRMLLPGTRTLTYERRVGGKAGIVIE